MNFQQSLPLILCILIVACKNAPPFEATNRKENEPLAIPESLPMKSIELSDISTFKVDGKNWTIGKIDLQWQLTV